MWTNIVINNNNNFVCIIDLLGMGHIHPGCNPFLRNPLSVCLRQFDGTVYKQVDEKNDWVT